MEHLTDIMKASVITGLSYRPLEDVLNGIITDKVSHVAVDSGNLHFQERLIMLF